MTYTNGDVYEGEFSDDKRNGTGKMTYTNGDVYEGEFSDDKRNGTGEMRDKVYGVYNGEWENDKRNGTGEMRYKVYGVYNGDWKNDKMHGIGKMKYIDGGVYNGDWKNNKRNGKGEMKYIDGSVYNGDWKDNEINGKGKMTYKNGDIDDGEWMYDVYIPYKKCIITDKNNNLIEDNTEFEIKKNYTIKENETVKYTFYFSEKPLGEGGFGKVFLCEKNLCEKKIVKIQDIQNKYLLKIVLKEVELLQRIQKMKLNDYFVEQIYSCFFGNKHLIFMEKMDISLHDFIYKKDKNKKYMYYEYYKNIENIAHICDQLLRGLKLLHEANIYHKDIKPDNIMLTIDDKTKVVKKVKFIDFGISCDINKYICNGSGTPIYMCPLSFDDNLKARKDLKDRSDLQKIDRFALGLTFFELIYLENNLNYNKINLDHLDYNLALPIINNYYINNLLTNYKKNEKNEKENELMKYISGENNKKITDEQTLQISASLSSKKYYLPIYDLINYKDDLKPIGPYTQNNNIDNSTQQKNQSIIPTKTSPKS